MDRELVFLVPHASRSALLLLRARTGWILPVFRSRVEDNAGFADAEPFLRWFAERHGFYSPRLCAIEPAESDRIAFVLDSPAEDWAPRAEARWGDLRSIPPSEFAAPEHYRIFQDWLASGGHSAAMPWARPGGFEPAFAWMRQRLEEAGIRLAGRIEQRKNTYAGCVFQCMTGAGSVFLKILPPVFSAELEAAEAVARWGVARLPRLIAAERERGWMLTLDMGGRDLSEGDALEAWTAAAREWARTQIAALPFMESPEARALRDARWPAAARRFESLIPRIEPLLSGAPMALAPAEIEALRQCAPRWMALVEEIARGGVPASLEHGDLRASNIRLTAEGIIFFDWAFASVAHPFLSMAGLLHCHRAWLFDRPEWRDSIRDAYLELWTGFGPMDRLRRLFEQVDRCKALHYALADAEWARAVWERLDWRRPADWSADAWTLERRQFYLAKTLRSLIG